MWFLTEEEKELQEMCRDFAANELGPKAAEHDLAQSFNMAAFRKMGELGLLGIMAPPEYGGAGMSALSATLAMEELGRHCASTALSYLAHTILCVQNIAANASEEQKKKYLPRLISGEWIGCMGMTEAEFGSDALGMQTKAHLESDGGENYILNGNKMWITNAPYADVFYVYARSGKNKKDITTFIVEKNFPGFRIGKELHKMGMRASPTGELIFEGTKVPKANRVGEEGSAVKNMMRNLDLERITIAGISLGIAEACLQQSVIYAKERKQFGRGIGEYQLIQKMIAEMSTETTMMRSFLYTVAKEYDLGLSDRLSATRVKLALPKMATKIALDAVQLHGGYGYGQEFPLERYLRDAKLMEIGGGTNEIMILVLAKQLLSS